MKKILHEGKAKIVYETENKNELLLFFKDDATAFNAEKKGTIVNKGIINLAVSQKIYSMLETEGIETHVVKQLSDRELIVKRSEIIPIELVVRNIIAGSLSKRVGKEEGIIVPNAPIVELYYKDDDLGDPMINEEHAVSFGFATIEELNNMKAQARKINTLLVNFFNKINVDLVDYKLEFGRHEGRIILCDELSPDSARLWDKDTKEKLDKDRFRRDMGNIEESYIEIHNRICN